VSTPFGWDELDAIVPDELTIATVPARLADRGDPWADMASHPQSLEPLLALHERDRAAGIPDAPWPPVYPKMPGEPPRVAPSRARKPPAARPKAGPTSRKPDPLGAGPTALSSPVHPLSKAADD
jgi:hypothetical protein